MSARQSQSRQENKQPSTNPPVDPESPTSPEISPSDPAPIGMTAEEQRLELRELAVSDYMSEPEQERMTISLRSKVEKAFRRGWEAHQNG